MAFCSTQSNYLVHKCFLFLFPVQGGQLTQEQIQQIPGFGPNASPPVFEKVFSNARFAQGGVAAFEGRITGKPQPTVSWTRKGAPLLNSQKHRLSYNETTGDVTLQVCNRSVVFEFCHN